jgi:hypothetical protein
VAAGIGVRCEHCCGPAPSEISLRRELNSIKRERFPWMYDVVGKAAVQEAIIDLVHRFRETNQLRGIPSAAQYVVAPR